jgi:alanine racemase
MAEPPLHRPVWAEVDLSAIRHNAVALRAHARARELMAVVKADGYGHGAVPVARAALEGGATWLGVALVEEGEQLRAAGITAPILVLSEPPPTAAAALLAAGLTPTIYTHRFVQALIAANPGPGPVQAHLKLDTGMRRVGLPAEHWPPTFAHLARATDRIRVSAIWSHLAVADVPDSDFTRLQAQRFADGVRQARAAGLDPDLLHLSNSGGTTLSPDLHLDMVRTGIVLYGCEAAPGIIPPGLRPAMALRARLSLVKPVAAGETVSYGRRWAAPVDTVVGTVPCGYADGIRRRLTNVGQVWVGGRRVPMVGTVCMDQFMIDLGPGSSAAVDDDVWLIGGPGEDRVTAEDWARWLDTITYEITCGIGARVPRVHLDG